LSPEANTPVVDAVASSAFQREAMRSEQVRIVGILTVLGGVFLFFVGRALFLGGPEELRLLLLFFALLLALAVYEGAMLAAVRRSIRRDRGLPGWSWTLNVVVETLLPTISLLILTESHLSGPYRALVAPAVLTYFFFITLSTLRLSPLLAQVTGGASAIGYAMVFTYTLMRHPVPPEGSVPLGRGIYLTYAVFLLIGGWIAGQVARQIRKHVTAALDEALQNERVRRDLEVARSIQQGLLPAAPPEIPGFDVAGWNQPADQTGGDFFYWERLGDGRTAVVLADVTGHGIGPALIASVSRAYGRACVTGDADLGATMTRIDDLLSKDLPSGKLVNFVLAVVDSQGAQVQVLSAGQAPLLIYRAASTTIESLNAHGVPLGVGLGLEYDPEREMVLEPGDMLVLVTDGFFEWENPFGEQFGLKRLSETIRQAKDLPAREIISALHSAVLRFANGTEQQDDLTAVIVKRERNWAGTKEP
jgi:serine phosphatase RsbU (regulator of sigma subunit)